jgi:hypothetical protein
MFRVFEAEIEIFNVFDAVLLLPVASVIAFAGIETVPLPPVAPDAVNATVREVPEVVSADSVPRVAVKSESVRSLTSSLNVIVTVQVLPAA